MCSKGHNALNARLVTFSYHMEFNSFNFFSLKGKIFILTTYRLVQKDLLPSTSSGSHRFKSCWLTRTLSMQPWKYRFTISACKRFSPTFQSIASFTIMRSGYKWQILAGHWTITGSAYSSRLLAAPKTSRLFGFRTHTTALGPMEQTFILSAKFDCPVARKNVSLLATAHDCELAY